MAMVGDMDYLTRMKMLSFLVAINSLVFEHNDGCRINISRLTPAELSRIIAFAERIYTPPLTIDI